jgi:hypothetical protein
MSPTRLVPLVLLAMALTACHRGESSRNDSSLIDNLTGVWVYPSEQPGDASVTIIEGMRFKIYDYSQQGYKLSRQGEVWGQEGVYFFPDNASYYSPKFFVEHEGAKLLILNKHDYDKYVRDGQLETAIWMRVGDTLDFNNPPTRPSIKSLGLPYNNIYADEGK